MADIWQSSMAKFGKKGTGNSRKSPFTTPVEAPPEGVKPPTRRELHDRTGPGLRNIVGDFVRRNVKPHVQPEGGFGSQATPAEKEMEAAISSKKPKTFDQAVKSFTKKAEAFSGPKSVGQKGPMKANVMKQKLLEMQKATGKKPNKRLQTIIDSFGGTSNTMGE